jgi:hypothetical protein
MPVVYSSKIYAFSGGKAVDGDLSSYWEGEAKGYPASISVDLVSAKRLGTAVIRLNPKRIWAARSQVIEVLVSDDGTDFRSLVPVRDYRFDPEENGNAVAIPLGTTARFVRLVVSSNSGATGAQVAEFELYGE